MTKEEIEELKGLAASMGLYDDKNPCKRAVILGKAIKALEQEPKQVELEGDGYAYGTNEIVYDFGKCPICGWEFEEGDKDWEEPYCCHCGQKLKWFDNEAESEDKE